MSWAEPAPLAGVVAVAGTNGPHNAPASCALESGLLQLTSTSPPSRPLPRKAPDGAMLLFELSCMNMNSA